MLTPGDSEGGPVTWRRRKCACPPSTAPLEGERCQVSGVLGDRARPDCLAHCRDGLPYCEADYHAKFGIRCDGCEKYITGHVLEVSPAPGGCWVLPPHEEQRGLRVAKRPVCLCKNPYQSPCHLFLPAVPEDTWERVLPPPGSLPCAVLSCALFKLIEPERWEGLEILRPALRVWMGRMRPGGFKVSTGGRTVSPREEQSGPWQAGAESTSGAGLLVLLCAS